MTDVTGPAAGSSGRSEADLVARLAAAGGLVSPMDDTHRASYPLAPRLDRVDGRRVVLLDIAKNRGSEFLDRVEAGLRARGATTSRLRKEIFSKPAAREVLRAARAQGDAVVQALAD